MENFASIKKYIQLRQILKRRLNNKNNMAKIFLADDNPSNLQVAGRIFGNLFNTYDLEFFKSGEVLEGRLKKEITNSNKDIAVVVLDNQMPPGKSGLELIEEYKKEKKFQEVPFILCYGGEESIGKKAVEKGAFAYLIKPYTVQQFVDVLRKVIK